MGIYYSLYEWYNPLWLKDRTRYVDEHMLPQMKEVVSRYKPAVIFADGEWDMPPEKWRSTEFLAWLYNESPVRDEVVVNDRWGKGVRHKHGGYYTTEYGAGMAAGGHAWEENRGMGYSYGYSRAEKLSDYRTGRELVLMLIDFVSRGGNFLLDVGPTGDGRIPVIMEQRLAEMGRWLEVNGEAIYGTRPWRKSVQWSEGERPKFGYGGEYRAKYDVKDLTGEKGTGKAVVEAFFTSRGDTLYAITPAWPVRKLMLKGVGSSKDTVVTIAGLHKPLEFEQVGGDIAIDIPALGVGEAPCEYAYVFKITGVK
jgi:alpha-L-fucosidase